MASKRFEFMQKALDKKKGLFSTRGWIKRKRELKGKIFYLLRDESGELQAVVDRAAAKPALVKAAEKATVESSVEIAGKLRPDKRAPGGVEMEVTSLDIVGLAEEFPIQRDFSTEYLLDVRHLWLRSQKMRDALKVRNTVFEAYHEFMRKEGFLEMQGPMFVTGSVEGGSTLFETPYFGKKAYLIQSSQFYLEVLEFSLGKVYTVAPSFRAEKSRTRRHLTEFWMAEAELPWEGMEEAIQHEEKMIQYIVKQCMKKNGPELRALGRDPKELKPAATKPFERYTYDEVFELAKKKFPRLRHGQDLGEKEERELTKDKKVPMVITHYPSTLKPFYHRPDPKDPSKILCNDVLAPEGYGEIIGGGERCWDKKELLQRLKQDKLPQAPYQWYIDLRRFGSIPHAGYGLGMDRLTAWVCKAEHIRDVIPFPRTMNRLYP